MKGACLSVSLTVNRFQGVRASWSSLSRCLEGIMLLFFSLGGQGRAFYRPLLISHTWYALNLLLCPQSPKLPNQCQQRRTGYAFVATKGAEMDYQMSVSVHIFRVLHTVQIPKEELPIIFLKLVITLMSDIPPLPFYQLSLSRFRKLCIQSQISDMKTVVFI